METTVFDTRYSSHINGTARPDSDDDTVRVFYSDSHSSANPLVANRDNDRLDGARRSVPLWKLLQRCLTGDPLYVDLLFLPSSAYIIPLPQVLQDNKDAFITKPTLQRYVDLADTKMQLALAEWKPKKAYHSMLYLNSAYSIVKTGRPAFYDPSKTEMLRQLRAGVLGKEEYFKIYANIKVAIERTPNSLPKQLTYRQVEALYREIVGPK